MLSALPSAEGLHDNNSNSINDLFRGAYQGLKSGFWQLIPRWSNGLVARLMTIRQRSVKS